MRQVRLVTYLTLLGVLAVCASGVAQAQLLSVSPQTLSFVYQVGGPNPAAQSILVSFDTPAPFAVSISGAPWLTVSPATGTTPQSLVVTATPPQNATPGTLSGTVLIGPVASVDSIKAVVAVTFQILAAPQGNLVVNPEAVSFDYRVGGPNPPPWTVSIASTGSPASFTLSTTAAWLFVAANSYVTPAVVQVSAVPLASMGPGTYSGTVFVTPTYAGGVTKKIQATLRVSSGGNLTTSPTSFSFSYQPGGPFPSGQSMTVVNSIGTSVSFSTNVTTTNGGNWLACSPSSGITPTSVVVSVNPGGMNPGSYYGTVNVSSGAGITPTQIPVSLTVYATSQLVVQPTVLTFNYQSGGPLPATQYLSVTSTGTPVTFTVTEQGLSWLTANLNTATTPAGIAVSVSPTPSTPPGTYSGSIRLTPNNGGGDTIAANVTVYVTAPNYLTVGRTGVSFNYSIGGTNPPPVIVPVTSSGDSLKFEAAAATSGQKPWLSVSQSSQYTPAEINLWVSPQGLTVGTYSGSVVVNSEGATNGTQTIAVTLVVTNAPSFTATPFGLVFSYQMSADPPKAQVFVLNTGSSVTPFTITPVTTTGGNWLMAVGGGSTPSTVAVAVDATTLAPGTYTGQIQVKSSDAAIPPLQMPVVLNVAPGPVYVPAGNLVSFQYLINGPSPAAQKIVINSNNNEPLVYYPTILTADGGSWLTATPDVGTTPGPLTISVNPKNLSAGTYFGLIGLNDPAGDTPISFVPVTLEIAADQILTVSSSPLLFSTTGVASIGPQQIAVNGTGRSSSFHVTTYGGAWLHATPTDGSTNAFITVTADTTGLTAGSYLGLVSIEIPGVANSQQYVPVVLTIAAGF